MAEIRACIASDFEPIFSLLQQLWPDKTLCRERLQSVFDRALKSGEVQRYLCAVEDGRIAGFCSMTLKNNLWVEGWLAHLDELVVDHAARGRGIGGDLLQAMIKLAEECGCVRVELDSAFHRKEAHAFYERRGFENRAYLFSRKLV